MKKTNEENDFIFLRDAIRVFEDVRNAKNTIMKAWEALPAQEKDRAGRWHTHLTPIRGKLESFTEFQVNPDFVREITTKHNLRVRKTILPDRPSGDKNLDAMIQLIRPLLKPDQEILRDLKMDAGLASKWPKEQRGR